jgi:hypothetical protein
MRLLRFYNGLNGCCLTAREKSARAALGFGSDDKGVASAGVAAMVEEVPCA